MIKESDLRVISSMILECNRLLKICNDYTDEMIINSFIYSDSLMYEFEKLFEYSIKLSIELQEDPHLHIHDLRGIRNRIAHRYESVTLSVLIDTVKHDIPILISILKNYLEINKD